MSVLDVGVDEVLVDGDERVRPVDAALSGAPAVPDPRAVQSLLALLVLVDLTVRGLSGLDVLGTPLLGGALALTLTGVAWLVPWTRVPPWWSAALVAVDLLAVGLVRLDPDASGPVALAAVPAYFLGRHFGRAGVVGAVLGVAGLVVLPQLLAIGVGDPANAWLLTTSLIVVAGAQIAALTVARLRRERGVAVAIIDSVPVGLVLIDASGRYASMNPVHSPLVPLAYPSGSTDGEALIFGADGTTLLARSDYPSARAARGEEFDGAVVWLGDDPATRRALSISARVVRDERGRFAGASLACHDITAHLHADAVKDEFVTTVSHELRTPLTSVLGYLEIALDRDDVPVDLRGQLEVSLRNARRLDGLVDDLLTTAGTGTGTGSLHLAPTDVADLVEQAASAARPGARPRGIRVLTEVEAPLTAVVDRARIGQVLGHLLSNAVKYTGSDGLVLLRARTEATDHGDELVVEVVDDGPGLEGTDHALLFTRFYRSERSRRDVVPGVGLGLAIVQDIVTAHGGRVDARNEPGRGAAFAVRLPCAPTTG